MSRRPEGAPNPAAQAAEIVNRGITTESPNVVGGETNVDAPTLGNHGKRRATHRRVAKAVSATALPAIAAGALGVSALRDSGSSTVEASGTSITSVVDAAHAQSVLPPREAAAPVVDAAGIPTNLGFELTAAHTAPAAGNQDTHVVDHKVKKGDIATAVAKRALKDADVDKPSGTQVREVTALTAALTPDVENIDRIYEHKHHGKPADVLHVPDETIINAVVDADAGKGSPELVAAAAQLKGAVTRNVDIDNGRTQAEGVLEVLGIDIPEPSAPQQDADDKGDPQAKAFDGVQPLEPQLKPEQLKEAVGAAETAGTVVEHKLTQPNIWTQEKEASDLNNAGTNPVARAAVVLTDNDPDGKVNKDGKFDEHKMHKNDAYDAIAPELVPLVAGIASMSQEQMEQLQDKLPADVFQQILTIWNVNHDQTDIAKRDQAMVESFLTLTKGLNMKTLKDKNPALFAFLGELGKKDNAKEVAGAIAGLTAEQLRQFFPGQTQGGQDQGGQDQGQGSTGGTPTPTPRESESPTGTPSPSASPTSSPETQGANKIHALGDEEKKLYTEWRDGTQNNDPKRDVQSASTVPLTDAQKDKLPTLRIYDNAVSEADMNNPKRLNDRMIGFSDFIQKISNGQISKEVADRLAEEYYEQAISDMPAWEKNHGVTTTIDIPPIDRGWQDDAKDFAWPEGAAITAGLVALGLGIGGYRRRRKRVAEGKPTRREAEQSALERKLPTVLTTEYPFYTPTHDAPYKMERRSDGLHFVFNPPKTLTKKAEKKFAGEITREEALLKEYVILWFDRSWAKSRLFDLKTHLTTRIRLQHELLALGILTRDPSTNALKRDRRVIDRDDATARIKKAFNPDAPAGGPRPARP